MTYCTDYLDLGDTPPSYVLRQHLDISHHLPAGFSYLVPWQDLSAFHAEAHARPGRIRGWLRLRRRRQRRSQR
jgi:hypothetical protein